MSKKMYSQKRFFRSFFPLTSAPQFLLFENIKTGSLDIVGRSGVILCSVPQISGKDETIQFELAKEILHCLDDGGFGLDYPVSADLCCWPDCQRYNIENCYYSCDDDFFAIIHPYNPDIFI